MFSGIRNFILSLLLTITHAAIAEPVNFTKHDNTTRQYLVGFAQDTLANDWRLTQVNELKKALEKAPNIKLIVTDAKGQTAKQISDIEDLISNKIDLLITSPRDAMALTPIVSKVHK